MKNISSLESFIFLLFLVAACQSNPYPQGQAIYKQHCENCHMEDGSGLGHLIPPIDQSLLIRQRPDSVICIIRNGITKRPATGQEMPGIKTLNEVELTNLLNFLRTEFSIPSDVIRKEEVEEWLLQCL